MKGCRRGDGAIMSIQLCDDRNYVRPYRADGDVQGMREMAQAFDAALTASNVECCFDHFSWGKVGLSCRAWRQCRRYAMKA